MFLLGVLPTLVCGQTSGGIATKLLAEKLELVVDPAGVQGERLVPVSPADPVVPGEEVIYTVRFANESDLPRDNVVIVQALPKHMVYAADTAVGPGTDVTFSIDGGATFELPVDLTVIDEFGAEQTALPQDYSHIRWIMRHTLAPRAIGYARFRAVFHYRQPAQPAASE